MKSKKSAESTTSNKNSRQGTNILPYKRVFFGLLKNDLDYTTIDELREKIHSQSHFSILYFVLLVTSVLVCTLGLLINSTAVVIGGMLIAPLMWPLARIGFGVARRARHHIVRGVILVAASVLIGTISAFLITQISPIKVLNDEIIARTQPNLMDLFIALAAGVVAAIALTQKKIADSLAGVAIAASLMPPLSTVGITLALQRYSDAAGALLLFAINAASISLVTAIIISYNLYLRTKRFNISTRAAVINALFVVLLAIPLAYFLTLYSYEVKSYQSVNDALSWYSTISEKGIVFENTKVEASGDDKVTVQTDVLLPSGSTFTYLDNEELLTQLRAAVGGEVILNLRLQNVFEPVSKDQQDNASTISRINDVFSEEIQKLDEEYRVSSISVTKRESSSADWIITAEVLVDPDSVPLSSELESLRNAVNEQTGLVIDTNITFLPRLTLRSTDQTLTQTTRELVVRRTSQDDLLSEISDYSLINEEDVVTVSYTVTTADPDSFDDEYMDAIEAIVRKQAKKTAQLQVKIIEARQLNR